jgi:3-deoxy-D-manno-octulosonate 8-phosphate phosphatase (KDO 8-P phosphatase)
MVEQGKSLRDRCRRIELLILDVDGVLTNGSIAYVDNGVEVKAFHVRDGSGLKIWAQAGKRSAIISGRASPTVSRRAAELGITAVVQGADKKLSHFQKMLTNAGLQAEQACYVGDDLPDLPVLCRCGLAVAVADACTDVRTAAHYVTSVPGGGGAAREVIELILRSQGLWHDVVAKFRGERLEE